MKIKIEYTITVTDEYRQALRYRYGETGLATRRELKVHFEHFGSTIDDDIIYEYQNRINTGE